MSNYGEEPQQEHPELLKAKDGHDMDAAIRNLNIDSGNLRRALSVIPHPNEGGLAGSPFSGMLLEQVRVAKEAVRTGLEVVREIQRAAEMEVARCKKNLSVLSYNKVTVLLPSNRTVYTEGIIDMERKYTDAVFLRDRALNAAETAAALLRETGAPRDLEMERWKVYREWKP